MIQSPQLVRHCALHCATALHCAICTQEYGTSCQKGQFNTVEHRLTATAVIRSPRLITATFFRPDPEEQPYILNSYKKEPLMR